LDHVAAYGPLNPSHQLDWSDPAINEPSASRQRWGPMGSISRPSRQTPAADELEAALPCLCHARNCRGFVLALAYCLVRITERGTGRRHPVAIHDWWTSTGSLSRHGNRPEPAPSENRPLGARLQDQADQAGLFRAIESATMFWLPVAHWIVNVIPAIRHPSDVRVSW
jgi:hypothetical protein